MRGCGVKVNRQPVVGSARQRCGRRHLPRPCGVEHGIGGAPGVRMATRGKHVHCQGAGSGVSGQFPLTSAAVSMAERSHRNPLLLAALLAASAARINGGAIIVSVNPAL